LHSFIMDHILVKTLFDFLHILATTVWIGSMFFNFAILRPAMIKTLSPPDVGKLMAEVMKKTRIVVYISIIVLGVTGIPLKIINENYSSIIDFENSWAIVSFIKHLCYGILVLLALYSFELLGPKVQKMAKKGPSPQFQQLQKKQAMVGLLAFLTAMVILILSSLMRYS